MGRPLPVPLSLVVVLALATACGSTVQSSSSVTAGGAGGPGGAGLGTSGGALSGTPVTAGPQGVAGTTGGPVTPGSRGVAGTTGGTGAGTTGSTGGPALSTDTSGPGVTATTIKVGFVHDANADGVNKAVGVGAISHGDDRANALAVVDDVNKHGGIAGRKVVPVFAPFDSTSTQTLDQQWSVVCQTFTRDDPVLFSTEVGSRASFRQCMHQGGAAIVSSSLPTVGAAAFSQYPGYLELGYPNVDRLAAYTVPSLERQGYFTPWNTATGQPAPAGAVKVGVLTYSDDVFSHAVDTYLVPALRKLGYEPVVEKVAPLTGSADLGAQAAAVKSAQLAFAANGVTHVLPFESNGGLSTFFLPTARTQGYYPRYGVNTASAAEALMQANAATGAQYNGAVGFGWVPSLDVTQADDPVDAPWSNAERRHCLKVMHDHGISFDSGNAEGIALSTCASVYTVQRALAGVHGAVTVPVLVRAAEALAASYQPPGTVGIAFAPGRHDPENTAYDLRYVPACTCMRYYGSARTVP